jgi:hypothetical protein
VKLFGSGDDKQYMFKKSLKVKFCAALVINGLLLQKKIIGGFVFDFDLRAILHLARVESVAISVERIVVPSEINRIRQRFITGSYADEELV